MIKNNENTIKVISPAKVNLFLAVGKKGQNVAKDYHPVLNIMHSLLLHDVLYFNYKDNDKDKLNINIEFIESEDIDIKFPEVSLEDNLIYKAIKRLAENYEKNISKDITVYVEKNIPHGAGLAGGSSNAAAAIVAAAKIFGINENNEIIAKTAQEVGCDVAFFLQGGCALYTGTGEIFDHKIAPINRDILLIQPKNYDEDMAISTKHVYEVFDGMDVAANLEDKFDADLHEHDENCHHDHDSKKMNLYEASKQIEYADNIPLFNNLAMASEKVMPQLKDIKEWLASKVGQQNVLLAGSGSVTFAIIPDDFNTEELEEEAKSKNYWTKLTQLANTKARIIPYVKQI